ncbi:hypothetical protein TrVE_jg838 [Triparma verrucosa]|uniref:Galactose oxidase n=1 Tax=Triparma verrucosa TaxID=1606542 RepID=A0A9W7F8K9_9STRA|nr:hypothetical protein TrVE_jg838 [Triparma verrucosa]
MLTKLFLVVSAICATSSLAQSPGNETIADWKQVSDGPWSKREGLMGLAHNSYLFMSGGRTNHGVGFSDEVWRSEDEGSTWTLASKSTIPPRAYHVHLLVDDCQYIMGGQTFFTFYNDIWESCDGLGEVWTQVTKSAEWEGRAGLAATVTKNGDMVVAGGCYNKNGNPARRSFYGDVWTSSDKGRTWTLKTKKAEWTARSGPRLVEDAHSNLLIIAGEIGFTPDTQLVDIWSSSDTGESWSLVTDSPGFSERSGHGVVVTSGGDILVIGGWPHLHDAWLSEDQGASFKQISNNVWNCDEDACGKFDFWPILSEDGLSLYTIGGSAAYSTFGALWQDTWVTEL